MSDDTVVRGEYVAPETKEQFESLRAFFDAKTSLDRVDSYAKWIFASSAIVGALGAGLSNGALPKAHAASLVLLTLSILCLGVSLVAACQSIAPKVVKVSLNNMDSMRKAVNEHFLARQRYINAAARLYGVAIFLAALVPLFSLFGQQSRPKLTYSVDAKGALAADAVASELGKGVMLELDVEHQGERVASAGTTADTAGGSSLHVGPVGLDAGETAVVLRQQAANKGEWKEVERVSIHR